MDLPANGISSATAESMDSTVVEAKVFRSRVPILRRPSRRPKTVELYRWLLRTYIAPHLGTLRLVDLDNNGAAVRAWRQQLLDSGISAMMAAEAYRLLRAVLNTAVEDEVIRRTPGRIKGASQENAVERPTLTPAQVAELAGKMPARYVALIMLTTYASQRWGEVTALRRADLDLETATLWVNRAHVELSRGGVVVGPPRSRAGNRAVSLCPFRGYRRVTRDDLHLYAHDAAEGAASSQVRPHP